MKLNEPVINELRNHLCDELSEILFEGRLSLLETEDAGVFGQALRDYFTSGKAILDRETPELSALMAEALEQGFDPSEDLKNKKRSLSSREEAFYSGLGAMPEPFTDIYDCYFNQSILNPGKNEIFVDGGAQDLFTSHRFSKFTKGSYDEIFAFEPEITNYVECVQNKELFDDRLKLFKLALGNKKQLGGLSEKRENSCLDINGKEICEVVRLDEFLNNRKVTYIKLHLEGGEVEALQGCEGIIRRWKPKMAVCLDHHPEDIAMIPALLLSMDERYRFYLRHYSTSITETVLYAV